MNKKDMCTTFWGQIVQDTKVFANQIIKRVMNKSPASHTSLQSTDSATLHYNEIQNMVLLQYDTLWEVQLALGEIPGMLEASNILQPCHSFSTCSSSSYPFSSAASPSITAGTATNPTQYIPTQQRLPSPRRYNLPDFAPVPMSFEVNTQQQLLENEDDEGYDDKGYDDEGYDDGMDDYFWFRSATAASHFVKSFDTYPSSYASSYSNLTTSNIEDETPLELASPVSLHAAPSKANDLRHDRKDSGVFIHDDDEGIILQVSPKTKAQAASRATCLSTSTEQGRLVAWRSQIMGDDLLQPDVSPIALSLPSLMATMSTLSI
ncbi:hypothetical protein EDD11_008875 [Mortierella claussenii]|nr:hypothetical protein EDD11_008875 [Mortierella claussenii]